MNIVKRILVIILLIFVIPKTAFSQNASENNIENNINFTAWTMSVDLISKLDSIVYSYAVGLIDDVSLFTKWLIVEADRSQNAGMKLILEFYRTSDILKEIMGIADSDINLINEYVKNKKVPNSINVTRINEQIKKSEKMTTATERYKNAFNYHSQWVYLDNKTQELDLFKYTNASRYNIQDANILLVYYTLKASLPATIKVKSGVTYSWEEVYYGYNAYLLYMLSVLDKYSLVGNSQDCLLRLHSLFYITQRILWDDMGTISIGYNEVYAGILKHFIKDESLHLQRISRAYQEILSQGTKDTEQRALFFLKTLCR